MDLQFIFDFKSLPEQIKEETIKVTKNLVLSKRKLEDKKSNFVGIMFQGKLLGFAKYSSFNERERINNLLEIAKNDPNPAIQKIFSPDLKEKLKTAKSKKIGFIDYIWAYPNYNLQSKFNELNGFGVTDAIMNFFSKKFNAMEADFHLEGKAMIKRLKRLGLIQEETGAIGERIILSRKLQNLFEIRKAIKKEETRKKSILFPKAKKVKRKLIKPKPR
ncbi:MAG: hypothetical protein JW703_02290 [Candidatus Diapherotrites archaeon]|nr:hypothetical protein [Candidatus Diapherotrites archaeon]